MTEDDHIAQGLDAEALLKHPAFDRLFDVVVEKTSRAILETTIEQQEERERLYRTVNGMRAFANELMQMVLIKENIRRQRDAEGDDGDF
uniref:hypothetical protein n=1 Tax=Methylobacterium sp. B34 TaxID=95563 RepID=UPI0005B25BE4|nr:hypothetical protein [Methylobacterium sp. B34]